MKYLGYTFVDEATKIPVSKEPARKGPAYPEGVAYLFHNEQSFSSGIPQFYGTAEDNFQVPDWMVEYSEEDFLKEYKSILSSKAENKLNQYTQNLKSDKNRLFEVYNDLTLSGVKSLKLKHLSEWKEYTKASVKKEISDIIAKISEASDWSFDIDDKVNKDKSLDSLSAIEKEINEYSFERN